MKITIGSNTRWWMKAAALSFAFLFIPFTPAGAQLGTWQAYMAYSDVQQIVKGGQQLYVRASNGLYTYNLQDQSITTYDKVNALNDCNIKNIAWNQQVKRLIVVYDNSNIDLMDAQGNVINLAALYLKSMTQDKTINRVDIVDQYAYCSTGFGVMKVDMKRCEVAESYMLGKNVTATASDGTYLYIQVDNGAQFMRGPLEKNLIDPHNWTDTATVPDGIFQQDLSDYEQYLPLVTTLKPGGPKYNNFAFLRLKHGRLYTAGGGYNAAESQELQRPANVQVLTFYTNEWEVLPTVEKGSVEGTEAPGWQFVDMMSVDADPSDPDHIFASGRTGLYEYRNGQLANYYHKGNSPLSSSLGNDNENANAYMLVESIMYDTDGSLWMLNSRGQYPLLQLTASGQWNHSQQHGKLMSDPNKALRSMQCLTKDSRGLFWFVGNHYRNMSFFCYNPQSDQLLHSFTKFLNEDGTSYDNYYPRWVCEDLDANVWIATSVGPFMMEAQNIYQTDPYLTQPKIPRNDGTNYADYLMNGANLSCIAIDGGNRKWMGTKGQGLYLISADNMEQLLHFTTENSPLLSDNIESLAYDGTTGKLYIGTDAGLCSYRTDAEAASVEMVKDDVYAYPNPVQPGYEGTIAVRGLTRDADVKIVSTSGLLVYQGRSNGGLFTWNGCDMAGRRVASGIYMVCAATSKGESGVVCKIAIVR